jgi:hypothetical protein
MIEPTWLGTPFAYLTNGGAIALAGVILLSIFGAFWVGRYADWRWVKRVWKVLFWRFK